MLLSFNWLKNYVKLPDSISPEEVAEKLKLSTVEVESIKYQGAGLENVVVGKVVSCEKHPNADKLKVCKVDLGNETVTIVCGGSNVAEGMLVAVAKNGARVKWHGGGELVELKPATIRGVESNGMICGADEIGLAGMFPKKDEKEIVDLSAAGVWHAKPLQPGAAMADVLGLTDAVFEIDNKSLSNRPDLWGHYGMAREVAVLFNRDVEKYETGFKNQETRNKKQEITLKVMVEDEKLCPKYMVVAMSGIAVGESPAWLKQKLTAVGLRPINNVVDITNYVMVDLGQPMHAFDAVRIANPKTKTLNPKIIVRRANDGEKFVTLDGKEHELTSEMLLIANEAKAVALAGVMGGLESGIANDTTTIVFESANFDAASIRKTSTKLGLRTDSSARFEKSLDPNLCEITLRRAVALIQEVCPSAVVASKVVSEGKPRLFTGPLEVPKDFFAKKLGMEIPEKTITTILERLGFKVEEKKSYYKITIPTWRATKDIAIPEDIVEEVVRIYGYDNVPASLPTFSITPPEKNPLRELECVVSDLLVKEFSYTEVYNYSFVSGEQVKKMNDDASNYLELDNPLSKEKPYLRRMLLSNLLENIASNQPNYDALRLFEIGKVFTPEQPGLRAETNGDELLPGQDTCLCAVYVSKKDSTPFWMARRVAERLVEVLNFKFSIVASAEDKIARHPMRTADILVGEKCVGGVYELHPEVCARFGIENRVGVLGMNLSAIISLGSMAESSHYHPVPQYPEVIRDLAFIVKKDVTHAEIVQSLSGADSLIKQVELFDVFEGKGIGEGYKSMAYHLTYMSPERTLTSQEVDAVQAKVEKVLKEQWGAEVRK